MPLRKPRGNFFCLTQTNYFCRIALRFTLFFSKPNIERLFMVPRICIIVGSESDMPAILPVLKKFSSDVVEIVVHQMSCHRTPEELRAFCQNGPVFRCFNAVFGVGGWALALPGIIDSWLHCYDIQVPVIGVALGEGKHLLEALASIEGIPGTPVVMDDADNTPYIGPEGLEKAIRRVIAGQLPQPKPRTDKPHKMNVWRNF